MVLALPGGQRVRSEVRRGSLTVGSIGGGVEVVEMMQRRRLEVLWVQDTKWKGDRARRLVGGYKLLHVGGDGRSNGVGIIVQEEIEEWDGRWSEWKDGRNG